ncbi:axonemal dynein light chain domain-containing protein 1 isoform X1 [Acipenser ruthenus]|uniref:axonemal dynein light chain domain-containing protein 1 isoform X1 n=1 Tax=Acipenser ruthenus TaxID=7906 RepID=UPI0027428E03|nr:axonemal dynein light chain domain-containing protein 1 isoform X1 [Acipenser ruthenus]XP_058887925.1 axonemal dynein light chain domain-containing protein 1 isoform X1 [Acipenser ruthenus]
MGTPVPTPPAMPRPEGKRSKSTRTLASAGDQGQELPELWDGSLVVDRSKPLPTSLQSDFIPEEILRSLTSTVEPISHPGGCLGPPKITRTPKDFKGPGLRVADHVWHHPVRRTKYKHLTDQPTSLTGAGRDISFLCDAIMKDRQQAQRDVLQNLHTDPSLSLVPEEFHIVKNKGVMGLEYYEDKYTLLLEDEEKRLKVFPSMKPSGRLEAVQLMRVMDTMLHKAGIDDEVHEVTEPTQMHKLLVLLKTEQNIYNVVFHELIRQVSVECAERGQLLSKLRERYVTLLDRIPRQLKSLHTETLAQQALDRHLTKELIQFKSTIGQLNSDLTKVREHDLRVSDEVEKTREELARTLQLCEKNVDMVSEYHDLYELQRCRLESQVTHLTQERDLWNSTTYKLALKLIEDNNLHLARKLNVSEKSWTTVSAHFTVVLMFRDTADMNRILQITDPWREQLGKFDQDMKKREDSGREKIKLVAAGVSKWKKHILEDILPTQEHGFRRGSELTLCKEFREWEQMLTEESECYGGGELLCNQEALQTIAELQEDWTDIGMVVFGRHPGPSGEKAKGHGEMVKICSCLEELHQQLMTRTTGDNGVRRIIMDILREMEAWSTKLNNTAGVLGGLPQTDWLKLSVLCSNVLNMLEEAVQLIGSTQLENDRNDQRPHVKLDTAEVFCMLQQFLSTMSKSMECENSRLTQEVSSIHTCLTRWMVDLLLCMVPNHGASCLAGMPPSSEEESVQAVALLRLEEEARILTEKLYRFSKYLTRSCRKIIVEEVQQQRDKCNEDPETELRELLKIRAECMEWTETCQILLSELKGSPVVLLPTGSQETQSVLELPAEGQEHRAPATVKPRSESRESLLKGPLYEAPAPQFDVALAEQLDGTALAGDADEGQLDVPGQEEEDVVVKFIGHDSNIYQRSLKGKTGTTKGEDVLVSRPQTEHTNKAFEALETMKVLQQQLQNAENRAQKAEVQVIELDEQLCSALERIQDLERQLQGRARLENRDLKTETVKQIQ